MQNSKLNEPGIYNKTILKVYYRIMIVVTIITEAGIYRELPPLILPAANHSRCNDVPVCAQWDAP